MRGWETIASDDLVSNILLMTSLVIGGITGCFAYLIARFHVLRVTSLHEPGIVAFYFGAGVGLVVTSVLFGLISSAVNAVLVCFASSPLDFENNHEALSSEMRQAWREVWPGALSVVERTMVREAISSSAQTSASNTPAVVQSSRGHRRAHSHSDVFASEAGSQRALQGRTAIPPQHRRTNSVSFPSSRNPV
jgi:Plasma-membrane choline transporter